MRSEPHLLFGPFRLDPLNAQLWRDAKKVNLRPKTFEVLRCLVDHPSQLVTKTALLAAVWTDLAVSDSMPAICVNELRKALGDEATKPRYIETVHRRGYRFVAKVTTAKGHEATGEPRYVLKGPRPIMVGRDEELERLKGCYSQVLAGQRRIVFIVGEAGIGKSTFAQAFLDSIAQDGDTQIGRGQCVEQYGSGEPYMPILEALTRLGQGSAGERVVEILRWLAPTWLAQMPALWKSEEHNQLESAVQGVTQQRMLREMTHALEALAAEWPLVLLLEDLHWSDFSTLELLSAIARRVESARLMIVGTYRLVEILANDHPLRTMQQELELHRYCEVMRLKLLNEGDVEGYLSRRLAGDDGRRFGTLAPIIHTRTDGNPLFMVNMIDYLLTDSGLVAGLQGVTEWAETLRVHWLDAPRSVRQMIECNLERLEPEEQAILEAASVAGAEFSAASVAAALDRGQNEVEAYCMRLSRRAQFISTQGAITWPDETVTATFRFHHSLYQEVLYSRLPPTHQVQFHQRIAAREEVAYGECIAEVATELAQHYSLANIKEKAIRCFQIAAERAVARGAIIEAEGHYRSALKHLAQLPRTTERDRLELAMQIALGSVLWTAKSWSHTETGSVFARARELADTLGDDSQIMAVLFGLFLSETGSARYGTAASVAQQMLAVAESSNNPESLSIAHTFFAETLLYSARYRDAQTHLELATALCAEYGHPGLSEWAFAAPALLAIIVLTLGYPERARELAGRASRYAAGCADPNKVGGVHLWLGIFNGMLRDASGERDDARVMRQLSIKHPVWNGLADFFSAVSKMVEGDYQAAKKHLENAIAFHESVGLVGWVNWFQLERAKLLAREGSVNDALTLASNAAKHPELLLLRVTALQLQAELAARSLADKSAIESAYRAAINCARSQEAKFHELQATTSFARWLKTTGRGIEAQTMLAEIYSWFTEGFDTHALKEAKAILDELTSETPLEQR